MDSINTWFSSSFPALHTPIPFLWRRYIYIGCVCIKNLKNKISHWGEEMPCVLSWSLRLRDWLHLSPSNLALSSSKYDKLSAEPIICVWLLLSLALSQPCPAELLDCFCPPCGSTKVRAIMSGGIFSQQNKELLAVATSCFGKITV